MAVNRAFPTGFVVGAATASYQIEGSSDRDGRGESIWDRFARTPGRVAGGDTGDIACDHYRRWQQDIALMADLGLAAYRFSIAWPRILPEGRGKVNPAGLDFYDRLVDGLLEAGIEPFVTLYHWDLPQPLEDNGGWPHRDTALAFVDYTTAVAARLGDRVHNWMTINEPWVAAYLGYGNGEHAPGRREPASVPGAGHHMLLAHGLATQVIRAHAPAAKVGLVVDIYPSYPVSTHPLDVEAAHRNHVLRNRWYLDPVAGLGYPDAGIRALEWDMAEVHRGDMETIAAAIDLIGVNYYSVQHVQHPFLASVTPSDPRPERTTDIGWEVNPDGLTDALEWIWQAYRPAELYVTENGAAYVDDPNNVCSDPKRVRFLHDHAAAAIRAIDRGVPLRGFFVWSLLDNFEWALGYGTRFGIVHVDYETQRRTPRNSARYWSAVAKSGELLPVTGYTD